MSKQPKVSMLDDFLTKEQIVRCKELYPNNKAIRDEVIIPNMKAINAKLHQENDPDYIAYLVVFILQRTHE